MNFTRRSALKLGLGSTAAAFSPIGVFFGNSAYAAVPGGPYLKKMGTDRFWFQRILENEISEGDPNKEYWQSSEGQLTARLGLSGGFSIGYFSTLSFLSDYKANFPDYFRDYFVNVAALPAERRKLGALQRLKEHRIFASKNRINEFRLGQRFSGQSRLAVDLNAGNPESDEPRLFANPRTTFTVNDFSAADTRLVFQSSALGVANASARRFENFSFLADRSEDIEVLEAAQAVTQSLVTSKFELENNSFTSDFASIDTDRLTLKEEGDDRLYIDRQNVVIDGVDTPKGFVEPIALALTVEDGVNQGKLAAIAFVALLEARKTLGDVDIPNESLLGNSPDSEVENANKALLAYADAQLILEAFSGEDLWDFGMDHAVFRPSLRICNTCVLKMPNGDVKKIDFETPFVPLEFAKTVNSEQQRVLQEAGEAFSKETTEYLNGQIPSAIQPPKSTQALPSAAFACCPSVRRHTIRLLSEASASAPELQDAEIVDISLTPTLTSPWIFAGMGAALAKTRLKWSSGQNNLDTPEKRTSFRRAIDSSIFELINRSIEPDNPEVLAQESVNNPAMAQYASGYTVAWTLADTVADNSAMAAGASAVYSSLHSALPEFFPALSDEIKGFTSAEGIADAVLVVARSIDVEIKSLRLQVTKLTETVEELSAFVTDLEQLFINLEGNAQGIQDKQALLDFQQKANDLISGKMARSIETYQLSALKSVQGLVNTFVTTSINVVNNIQASARANVQVCSPGGVQK